MMTISDFFLIQTTSEIKNQFEKIGLNYYRDVPDNIQDFCNKFNLLNDGRCQNFYVYKRRSTAEIHIYLTLPNPSFPECPIVISAEFYAKSRSKGCSITRGGVLGHNVKNCLVFKKVSDIFDNRPNYNNIEYSVYMEWLIDVREPVKDYNGNIDHYILSKNKTLLDLYDSICRHVIGVAPLIKAFVSSTEDGSWEKMWDKLIPREKWNRGDEVMKGMYSASELSHWYRAVKAGIKPEIEEFVKYYVATCCCGIGPKRGSLDRWDSDDKDAANLFKYILSEFDKKYIIDNSMDKWNKIYSDANEEFVDEVNLLRTRLSQKYNINEKYIEINNLFGNRKDFNWTLPDVPGDAYLN